MFERAYLDDDPAGHTALLRSGDITAGVRALGPVDGAVSDAERVAQIRALEELKAAAAAAQALVTADFAASQEAEQAAAGVPRRDLGRGAARQVGLAKRESPARASRFVGWAKTVTTELPATFAALASGQTTEWRATLVARETACLPAEHRAMVDAELGSQLVGFGDRQVEAETRKAAYRLDPYAVTKRARQAENDRRVSLRPAPDTMARLTALLPVTQGVAVFAALGQAADSCRAAGDERGRGQIMADTLVERVTGQAMASAVPVQVNLVMTDTALIDTAPLEDTLLRDTRIGDTRISDTRISDTRIGDDVFGTRMSGCEREEPGHLLGYGPVPAPWARDLIRGAGADTPVWLPRLYTAPGGGDLVAMDSSRRLFDGALREFVILRDQVCRTPWCDAPIRHLDHVEPAEHGGPTSAANGQGSCEACNHSKQAPGWKATAFDADAGIGVATTTPTGHRYLSRPPKPPGRRSERRRLRHAPDISWAEERLRSIIIAA